MLCSCLGAVVKRRRVWWQGEEATGLNRSCGVEPKTLALVLERAEGRRRSASGYVCRLQARRARLRGCIREETLYKRGDASEVVGCQSSVYYMNLLERWRGSEAKGLNHKLGTGEALACLGLARVALSNRPFDWQVPEGRSLQGQRDNLGRPRPPACDVVQDLAVCKVFSHAVLSHRRCCRQQAKCCQPTPIPTQSSPAQLREVRRPDRTHVCTCTCTCTVAQPPQCALPAHFGQTIYRRNPSIPCLGH